MNTVSRRAALVGASAVAGSVVNLVAITVGRSKEMPAPCRPADTEPDAELIRLFNKLQHLWSEACRLDDLIERGGEIRERYDNVVHRLERAAGVPEEQKKWTKQHCHFHIAAHIEAEKQVPEWRALQDADEDQWLKLDGVMRQICDLPATTVRGLQAKAFAAYIVYREQCDKKDFSEHDWDDKFIVDLIQSAICAGYPGMPRREETRQQDEAVLARQS